MTTPYAVSRNIGSVSYNNYVNSYITGPLSTGQTAKQIPYHNHGVLTGIRPTPPQFFTMQTPLDAQMNTNARHQYLRTSVNKQSLEQQKIVGKLSPPMGYVIGSSNRQVPVSSHTNYIPPLPASLHINILKSNAVGQSGYKVNLPIDAPTSTKNYYPSGTRSSLRRARSGGCVAPKKKGAIQNMNLSTGNTNGWGSYVRQNY